MKHRFIACALALVLLCLTGCGWIKDEYTSVAEHEEPYVYTEPPKEETIPAATNANVLQNRIVSFVRSGVSRGQIDVTGFSGDVREQIPAVFNNLRTNPIYAYAVDYSDYEFFSDEAGQKELLEIRMVFRRSAEEIASIVNVVGVENAHTRIVDAVENMDAALTMKVSDYEQTDFAAAIRRHCMENPTLTAELPEVSVQVYPDEGSTRIVELHFGYSVSREELRSRRSSVETTLGSAAHLVYAEDPMECLRLLCEYLLSRDTYSAAQTQEAPVYQLLSLQQAGDAGFASAANYLLRESGMDCILVLGEKNGLPYAWNIVCVDGQYYHLDLMQQWENGQQTPVLLYDTQRAEYTWDAEQYPACPEPATEEDSTLTQAP